MRLLSLESRLGEMRRRRYRALLRHLIFALGPVLIGLSLFFLVAATGALASLR